MIHRNFIIKIVVFLFLLAPSFVVNAQQSETVTYEGQLQVGKRESTIIYLGEESGDLAAFCFPNKSSVGRTILSKCKNKELCKFVGRVNWSGSCSISGGFSARAKIVLLKSVRKLVRKRRA
jgi:hypothetical protein